MKTSTYILTFLLLVLVFVGFLLFSGAKNEFKLVACDVGQGDAILAIYKTTEVLTDGGVGNKIIGCLERYMPFYDRKIELVVSTHPDRDHSEGLIEVFKRYKVDTLLINSVDSSTNTYRALKNMVGGSDTKVVYPQTGMKIGIGLIHLDVVQPTDLMSVGQKPKKGSDNVLGLWSTKEPLNDLSINTILSFGNFDALLTGDIGPKKSDEVATILQQNYSGRAIEYLKVPHHGSVNGLTENLLKQVNPKVAVISVGKNNSYGHPNKPILDMLGSFNIKTLRTDLEGDVVVTSDGTGFKIQN